MKTRYESNAWTPEERLPLFFRSQMEAAWLRDAGAGGAGHSYPASSLVDERKRRICEAAYFKAERRGFAPGHALEDWLQAEQEVDTASRALPQW
jgi:hypothetical protein